MDASIPAHVELSQYPLLYIKDTYSDHPKIRELELIAESFGLSVLENNITTLSSKIRNSFTDKPTEKEMETFEQNDALRLIEKDIHFINGTKTLSSNDKNFVSKEIFLCLFKESIERIIDYEYQDQVTMTLVFSRRNRKQQVDTVDTLFSLVFEGQNPNPEDNLNHYSDSDADDAAGEQEDNDDGYAESSDEIY
ncbi:hypothetical protein BN7_5559 [Wickerhamomyces ciferrii]|uniref:Uncharacterized protein n=1 Tax=Wickerhamomyces ciferrii (strain ATCC 14091 / BCRC 22168 / CBS 111 / JCM 3599 / NBRC 0793 / NRRL Y-1031 F-60-10) TaxID=1206466 RepID=K0KVK8_WICCF|nr:uncharacterized protein BN7_5559 [Wickerhamomyces ciferrii]CCH45972.1 hypothetical protein BN7_5559 [Wickerhamomyces ciferrii]